MYYDAQCESQHLVYIQIMIWSCILVCTIPFADLKHYLLHTHTHSCKYVACFCPRVMYVCVSFISTCFCAPVMLISMLLWCWNINIWCTWTFGCQHMYIYSYLFNAKNIWPYISRYIYIYICIRTCMHTCIHTYTHHMHAYVHAPCICMYTNG